LHPPWTPAFLPKLTLDSVQMPLSWMRPTLSPFRQVTLSASRQPLCATLCSAGISDAACLWHHGRRLYASNSPVAQSQNPPLPPYTLHGPHAPTVRPLSADPCDGRPHGTPNSTLVPFPTVNCFFSQLPSSLKFFPYEYSSQPIFDSPSIEGRTLHLSPRLFSKFFFFGGLSTFFLWHVSPYDDVAKNKESSDLSPIIEILLSESPVHAGTPRPSLSFSNPDVFSQEVPFSVTVLRRPGPLFDPTTSLQLISSSPSPVPVSLFCMRQLIRPSLFPPSTTSIPWHLIHAPPQQTKILRPKNLPLSVVCCCRFSFFSLSASFFSSFFPPPTPRNTSCWSFFTAGPQLFFPFFRIFFDCFSRGSFCLEVRFFFRADLFPLLQVACLPQVLPTSFFSTLCWCVLRATCSLLALRHVFRPSPLSLFSSSSSHSQPVLPLHGYSSTRISTPFQRCSFSSFFFLPLFFCLRIRIANPFQLPSLFAGLITSAKFSRTQGRSKFSFPFFARRTCL